MSAEAPESPLNRFELAKLPSELIGHILSFDDLAIGATRLWKSGSNAIRHHIRRSVYAVTLSSHMKVDFAKLPSMLSELASLRSLKIDRQGMPLVDISYTSSILRSLPPCLETLVMDFKGAAALCEPNPALRSPVYFGAPGGPTHEYPMPTDADYVDLAACFPRLQTLILEYRDSFRSPQVLPRSLTHLECGLHILLSATGVVFPPLLTHMALFSGTEFPAAFWDALPRGLEILDLRSARSGRTMTLEQAEKLPRSLKTLLMHQFMPWNPSIEQLAALPRQQLETLGNAIFDYNGALSRLFPSMTALTNFSERATTLSPSQLRELSRSFTFLSLTLTHGHQLGKGDFPPSLTTLDLTLAIPGPSLQAPNNTVESIGLLLPAQLTSLKLASSQLTRALINQLPPNLTRLIIISRGKIKGTETLTFPPSLTELEIDGQPNLQKPVMAIGKIPDTVTRLDLRLPLDVSSLFMLPSRLREAHFTQLRGLTAFNPQDSKAIERILHLRKAALESGLDLNEPSPPREYGVWDFLPQSLTKLNLGDQTALADLGASVWQSLPQSLSQISLSCGIHPNSLEHFPLENMIQLSLSGVQWRDEHIKRLNPRLQSFKTTVAAAFTLTPACAPWIPRDLHFSCIPSQRAQSALQKLSAKRSECLAASDRQGFNLLIQPPSPDAEPPIVNVSE